MGGAIYKNLQPGAPLTIRYQRVGMRILHPSMVYTNKSILLLLSINSFGFQKWFQRYFPIHIMNSYDQGILPMTHDTYQSTL